MSATQKLLRFGVFELNLDTEELRKSDTVVKLPPQPLKLLALLTNHAGQVVSRDQIQRKLWDDESEVDVEHVVNKCIKQIRTVLGDNADKPLYIETLPRQGYRFIAPVVSKEIPAPRPMVVESDSGERGRVPAPMGGRGGAPAAVVVVAPDYSAAVPDADAAAGPATDAAHVRESHSRLRRNRLVWIGLAVVLVASVGGLYWSAHKPLARFHNLEWILKGSTPASYEAGTDRQTIYNGHPSACLRSKESVINGFGTLMQSFQADKYRGKRVRFSAFAKSEKIQDWAGLWMRVDRDSSAVAFDNMQDRPIRGTTPWRNYSVVLDVPQDATGIFLGVLLSGTGKVWLNDVKFEAVAADVPTTGEGDDEPKLGFEN